MIPGVRPTLALTQRERRVKIWPVADAVGLPDEDQAGDRAQHCDPPTDHEHELEGLHMGQDDWWMATRTSCG